MKTSAVKCFGKNESRCFTHNCLSSCICVGILAWTAFDRLHSFPVGLKYWPFKKKDRFYSHYTYIHLYSWLVVFVFPSCSQCSGSAMVQCLWSSACHAVMRVCCWYNICSFVQAKSCIHPPKNPTVIDLQKRGWVKLSIYFPTDVFCGLMETQEIPLEALTMFSFGSRDILLNCTFNFFLLARLVNHTPTISESTWTLVIHFPRGSHPPSWMMLAP